MAVYLHAEQFSLFSSALVSFMLPGINTFCNNPSRFAYAGIIALAFHGVYRSGCRGSFYMMRPNSNQLCQLSRGYLSSRIIYIYHLWWIRYRIHVHIPCRTGSNNFPSSHVEPNKPAPTKTEISNARLATWVMDAD